MNTSRCAAPGLLALLAGLTLSAAPRQDRAAVQVTNLGFAASTLAVDAGFAAFGVLESMHGGADLNGDGDAFDEILHLHDTTTGNTTNLGHAIVGELFLHGGFLAYTVDEWSSNWTDLNGDGDYSDQVAHVRDLSQGTTANLGLARSWSEAMGEGAFVFDVSEASQNATDLNGDGDAVDQVIHVHDLASGVTTNSGLAGDLGSAPKLRSSLALVRVNEISQGSGDLNGDGDVADVVLHAVQLPNGAALNTGLAASGGVAFSGRVALAVPEISQGGADLNGDGDFGDEVLHVYDVVSSTASSLSLAVTADSLTRVGSHLAFLVEEWQQGPSDLNSDSDAGDSVMHVHDMSAATTVNLSLACLFLYGSYWADGERLAFPVREQDQGWTDLNGDSDTWDAVVHTYDPVRGLVNNLALASSTGVVRGRRLTISVSELEQGATDLNGDGDTTDGVLFEHDLLTGVTNNLALAGTPAVGGNETLLEISEVHEGTDLNGDLDAADLVPFAHESFAGAPDNLGLAGYWGGFDEGLQLMSVWEQFHGGTDLNGDGDAQDWVPHLVEPLYPFGFETDADTLSVGAGGTLAFALDAGHAHGGAFYLILGSFSGTVPGLWIGGFLLPLNYDPYFELTMRAPNAPPFTASLGLLDFMGEGQAAFTLPPGGPPVLIGLTANHAYVALAPLTGFLTFVSNPVPLGFVP